MSKKLYGTATGVTGLLSVSVTSSHDQATAVANVKCRSTTLSIGDAITIDLGYEGDYATVFYGYVKKIIRSIPEDTYEIQAYDVLIRAKDYFIASTNPDAPFTRSQINAEDLVGDILALAQLTDYEYEATSFIYAYSVPVEINLVGCYDICNQIADMLAWHIWADSSGTVYFKDRKPYMMAGDVSDGVPVVFIGNATRTTTDEDLRNRVVVYGASGIYAEASASSPYLPAGFYKTAVLASSLVIDLQSMADTAAAYNLATWNRLKTTIQGSIEGNPEVNARSIVRVTESEWSEDRDWYVYSATHTWGKAGYKTELELRQ